MKNKLTKSILVTVLLLGLFLVWTALVCAVDRQPIGPEGSVVGMATMNGRFHDLTGEHMALYELTDFLSVIPFAIVGFFALLGGVQFLKRKSLFKVDADVIALGAFYLLVLACYALFEVLVVNYRPVLIEGELEASYPSSTTMLALAVLPTAAMQVKARVKNRTLKSFLTTALIALTLFMVSARLNSGVHWLSDIIGGVLLSAALVAVYVTLLSWIEQKRQTE